MVSWKALGRLSDADLAMHDIAEVNLACAHGLPGAERIDVTKCLQKLDEWAKVVRQWTRAAYWEYFRPDPAAFNHSEAYFKVVSLVTALFRHCGVRYDPAKVGLTPNDGKFDLHEAFVFGVTDGPGGTCANLPVVYAAVGRRLGYPIRITKTKYHLFARWDDPEKRERINFEGGNDGYAIHPDEHYRQWPSPISPEIERAFGYLESLTPRRELAEFLGQRAYRLTDHGRYREAVETFIAAAEFEPGLLTCTRSAVQWLAEWKRRLQVEYPPGFPQLIEITRPLYKRRWPWVPSELEREVASLHALEFCLRNPLHERIWWAPLRAGKLPDRPVPTRMTVNYEALLQTSVHEETSCTPLL